MCVSSMSQGTWAGTGNKFFTSGPAGSLQQNEEKTWRPSGGLSVPETQLLLP